MISRTSNRSLWHARSFSPEGKRDSLATSRACDRILAALPKKRTIASCGSGKHSRATHVVAGRSFSWQWAVRSHSLRVHLTCESTARSRCPLGSTPRCRCVSIAVQPPSSRDSLVRLPGGLRPIFRGLWGCCRMFLADHRSAALGSECGGEPWK